MGGAREAMKQAVKQAMTLGVGLIVGLVTMTVFGWSQPRWTVQQIELQQRSDGVIFVDTPTRLANEAERKAAAERMETRVDEPFQGTLAEFVVWIEPHAGRPVLLDVPTLELSGVDADQAIDLTHLQGSSVRHLLGRAQRELSDGFVTLSWWDRGDEILLTDRDTYERNSVERRIYDISEILQLYGASVARAHAWFPKSRRYD
jgi:hypothetical protein